MVVGFDETVQRCKQRQNGTCGLATTTDRPQANRKTTVCLVIDTETRDTIMYSALHSPTDQIVHVQCVCTAVSLLPPFQPTDIAYLRTLTTGLAELMESIA